MRGILTSHILLSQKSDPRRCNSYSLIKRCKCVEYFPNPIFWYSFDHDFLPFYNYLRSMGYLSLFSIFWNLHVFHSFSSFLLLFWELHVSLFFSIAPYFFFGIRKFWRERPMINEWSIYFRWMKKHVFV